ncbi:hypothetical protein L6R52_25950 [Myxococcota bacterium]|nr:hypothetical protein [Myxococcota bacterium]
MNVCKPACTALALATAVVVAACGGRGGVAPLADAGAGDATIERPDATATPLDASIVDAAAPDAAEPDATVATDASAPADPFAPLPDRSEGLVNVGADLDAVLERGALDGACERAAASPGDRRLRLLCGKSLFFYGTFGTAGVPAPIIDFLTENFDDQLGPGFERLGMVADPRSTARLPIGLAPSVPAPGSTVATYAFTCASCHFARLPDGRYAVGAANHAFEYGTLNLAIALFPVLASGRGEPADHDAAAVAKIQPLLDHVEATRGLRARLLLALLPLVGLTAPSFPVETEHHYATWKSGTMDFLIEPLPANDGVHTISKISSLFGIPTDDEMRASGMPHAMLGFTGISPSLEDFALGFVSVGGGDVAAWPASEVAPLVEYILTLRPPEPATVPPEALVAEGRRVFEAEGCLECHAGPRGSGTRLFTYEEIGTDPAMAAWGDDGTGRGCCNLPSSDVPTHALKSPRLVGLWAMTRFLHNGAVGSLEDVLCMRGPRPTTTELAYGDQGHVYGCELPMADREALIAYLGAH